jgi:hypothetical protein
LLGQSVGKDIVLDQTFGFLPVVVIQDNLIDDTRRKCMTDSKTASNDENVIGGSKPVGSYDAAPVSGVKRSESDERRFQDTLEDDEVREALRVLRVRKP